MTLAAVGRALPSHHTLETARGYLFPVSFLNIQEALLRVPPCSLTSKPHWPKLDSMFLSKPVNDKIKLL